MKNAAVVLGLGSVFLLALAAHRSVAGEPSHTYDGYWECRNMPIQQTAYFGAVFEASADLGVEWLLNFAHTNHFDYAPVNYTYP